MSESVFSAQNEKLKPVFAAVAPKVGELRLERGKGRKDGLVTEWLS